MKAPGRGTPSRVAIQSAKPTVIFLMVLLPLMAAAQIGGYFKLGPIPSSVVEGHKFTVSVTLETTAQRDTKLSIEAVNLSAPSELVIPNGQKAGSFEVKVGYSRSDVRTARPGVGRLIVSSGRSRVGRDITIVPRGYR